MPSTPTDRLFGLTTSVAVKAPVQISADYNVVMFGEQTITSSTFTGTRTITTTNGMRVLLMGQTNPIDNGIWLAMPASWVRAPDFDGARDAVNGTLVFSVDGDCWQVEASDPIHIGYDPIEFRSTYPFNGGLNTWQRSLRVPETYVGELPPKEERDGHLLAFNNEGDPICVLPESGSAADVLIDLASTAPGKGAYLIGFNDPTTGATNVDAALKARPTLAALNASLLAGNGSTIGYRFASDSVLRNFHDRFAETLSIMDYVQSTDAGDYSLALQRIFTKYVSADSFHVKFPAGYFQFKTQAVYNGNAVVSIEGCQGTKWSLEWNNSQANIAITSVRRIFLDKIEIEAKEVVGQTKTGIYLNCTGQDYSHNINQILATATISSANTGIIMFDIVNFSLGDVTSCYVRYFGVGSTTHNIDEFSNNFGWRISATTKVSTDSTFKNCATIGLEYSYLVSPPNGTSGYLEGVTWVNCTVVGCLYGPAVRGDNTQTYRSPMYRWMGGHIFAYKACLDFYWVSQVVVSSGAHLYLVYDSLHSGSFGNSAILINECVYNQINDVFIRMTGQITGASTSQGIYIGTNCAITSITDVIVTTGSQSRGVVSVPGSKYTTAFNVKVYYSGIAPTAAVALGGTNDEDLGGNSVRAA